MAEIAVRTDPYTDHVTQAASERRHPLKLETFVWLPSRARTARLPAGDLLAALGVSRVYDGVIAVSLKIGASVIPDRFIIERGNAEFLRDALSEMLALPDQIATAKAASSASRRGVAAARKNRG